MPGHHHEMILIPCGHHLCYDCCTSLRPRITTEFEGFPCPQCNAKLEGAVCAMRSGIPAVASELTQWFPPALPNHDRIEMDELTQDALRHVLPTVHSLPHELTHEALRLVGTDAAPFRMMMRLMDDAIDAFPSRSPLVPHHHRFEPYASRPPPTSPLRTRHTLASDLDDDDEPSTTSSSTSTSTTTHHTTVRFMPPAPPPSRSTSTSVSPIPEARRRRIGDRPDREYERAEALVHVDWARREHKRHRNAPGKQPLTPVKVIMASLPDTIPDELEDKLRRTAANYYNDLKKKDTEGSRAKFEAPAREWARTHRRTDSGDA